jgi:hypothetical protein
MTLNWRKALSSPDFYVKYNSSEVSAKSTLEYYDLTHAHLWDQSDYIRIKKVYDLIKMLDKIHEFEQKRESIRRFEKLLQRADNDQSAFFENDPHNRIEPMDHIVKEDRILNSGRTRAAELIAGEAGNRFDYAAIGLSQIPVSDSDTFLPGEANRINLRLSGYASASGAIIKHSALWTPGLPSNTYWEFGAVDYPIPNVLQMLWCRVVFPPNKGLVHVQNVDFFTVTHSTYTTSVI